jgi:hypothetical protein
MTINENRDYLRWKAMRVNQEDSQREVRVYTETELYLKDLDNSARDGFVSAISLDCFVNEINSVSRRNNTNKVKKKLEEKASRTTLNNLYAMTESASRVADTNSINDFIKYKYEALKIAEDYGLDKRKILAKFDSIKEKYGVKI